MRRIMIGLVVLFWALAAMGEGFGSDKVAGRFLGVESDLIFGVCSYVEEGSRQDVADLVQMGTYFQFPIVRYRLCRISFGVLFPFSDCKRTRPEFSVSHLFGDDFGFPYWMPLEVGIYGAMSPWIPWGVQVGLLRVSF